MDGETAASFLLKKAPAGPLPLPSLPPLSSLSDPQSLRIRLQGTAQVCWVSLTFQQQGIVVVDFQAQIFGGAWTPKGEPCVFGVVKGLEGRKEEGSLVELAHFSSSSQSFSGDIRPKVPQYF